MKRINTFKDPVLKFSIESFSKLTFDLKANILVKGGEKERENIFSIVRDSLNAKFSFKSREFGQPVTVSEVMSVIQQIKGVVAVDINYLCRSDKKEEICISSIPSSIAHWDDTKGAIAAAELLVLNPARSIFGSHDHMKKTRYTKDELYNLLPAVYRQRDTELAGKPLESLISVIAEQVQYLEEDIEKLYNNWFIETCDEWVVPYISDLVGAQVY